MLPTGTGVLPEGIVVVCTDSTNDGAVASGVAASVFIGVAPMLVMPVA